MRLSCTAKSPTRDPTGNGSSQSCCRMARPQWMRCAPPNFRRCARRLHRRARYLESSARWYRQITVCAKAIALRSTGLWPPILAMRAVRESRPPVQGGEGGGVSDGSGADGGGGCSGVGDGDSGGGEAGGGGSCSAVDDGGAGGGGKASAGSLASAGFSVGVVVATLADPRGLSMRAILSSSKYTVIWACSALRVRPCL